MSQFVRALLVGPMIGNENRVGTYGSHNQRTKRELVAPRGDGYPIAICDFVFLGQPGMQLDARFRVDVDQAADAARLGAGEILRGQVDSAAAGVEQRQAGRCSIASARTQTLEQLVPPVGSALARTCPRQ